MSSTEDEIKELVIARLSSLPADKEISIGSDGSFNRDELIGAVERGDAIGKKMIDVEMSFLRSLKDGSFFYDE